MAELIGFIGGPSTGKTTLAKTLFQTLQTQNLNVAWASEFVSDDVRARGTPDMNYYIYEQYRFLFHQLRRETEATLASDLVLTDSPLLIGYAYTIQQKDVVTAGRQSQFIEELYDLFKQDAQRYDKLYLLEREAGFEDNGIRFHNEEESRAFDGFLKELLEENNVAHIPISGSVAQRQTQVLADLGNTQSLVG